MEDKIRVLINDPFTPQWGRVTRLLFRMQWCLNLIYGVKSMPRTPAFKL